MIDIVWQSKLDNKFQCEVVRLTDRTGKLTVLDEDNSKVLLEQEVGLSYGAQFGPDIGDVAYWQDLCVNVVDKQ